MHVDSILWYFIVLIWLPLYVVDLLGSAHCGGAEMKRDLVLWTAFLAGPLVWLSGFGARWSLSGWVCAFNWKPALGVFHAPDDRSVAAGCTAPGPSGSGSGARCPGEAGGAIPGRAPWRLRAGAQRVFDAVDRGAGHSRSDAGGLRMKIAPPDSDCSLPSRQSRLTPMKASRSSRTTSGRHGASSRAS